MKLHLKERDLVVSSQGHHRFTSDLSESPASNDVNTDYEESPSLGSVTKQRLLETVTN